MSTNLWVLVAVLVSGLMVGGPARAQGGGAGGPVSPLPGAPAVPREFRAAWIATVDNIDWPSERGLPVEQQKREMIEMLDHAAELGLNAVVFQVRPHADAMFPSELEPWSGYLTGTMGQAPEPAYDPLAMMVEEAHRRGIQVHAWFNPYRAFHPAAKTEVPDNHVSKTMPDAVHTLGDKGQWMWMDPADQRVQRHTINVILDVMDRYDIDGVHFDDYFYPYPSYNEGKDFPDDRVWKAYQASGGQLSRADFRRKAVNDFVEELSAAIRNKKPHVMFGISPFGIYRPGNPAYIKGFDQYEQLYADAHLWLTRGWVDYMAPQLYWNIRNPDQSFVGLLDWWTENNPQGRHIWPGLGAHRLEGDKPQYDADEIPLQIKWTRVIGEPSAGHIHFPINALQKNHLGVAERLKKDTYATPALVPASPWMDATVPAAPEARAAKRGRTLTVRVEDGSLPGGLHWVLQAYHAGKWTTRIVNASQDQVEVELPEGRGDTTVRVMGVSKTGILSTPWQSTVK